VEKVWIWLVEIIFSYVNYRIIHKMNNKHAIESIEVIEFCFWNLVYPIFFSWSKKRCSYISIDGQKYNWRSN
jgi:hypothetical protein